MIAEAVPTNVNLIDWKGEKKTTTAVYNWHGEIVGQLLGTWELKEAIERLKEQFLMGIHGFYNITDALSLLGQSATVRYY